MTHPTTAYKVLTGPEMDALESDGSFAGAPVDLADGYIHLSTAEQLTETVDKHFAGQDDLHVVAVDLNALDDAVRWEESRGGQLFPHIYAALPLAAVIAYSPLERDDAGRSICRWRADAIVRHAGPDPASRVTSDVARGSGSRVKPGMTKDP